MNNSEIRFTLDLQKSQSQVSIPVKLGDTARTLRITITDGGEPFVIADSCIAMLSAVKSNGYKIFRECIIEEGTIIRYDFDEHTATAEGITECEIVLYGDNNNTDTAVVVGSARFIMVVDAQVLARKDDILEAYIEDDDLGGFDGIISAEVSRQEAEKARVEAENARVEAEEERGEFIESLVWETEVNDSEMPPTSKAVKEYSVKRESVAGYKIYGASNDGDVMFDAVITAPIAGTLVDYDEYCLPRYDWNGNITSRKPVYIYDCVNKDYFDTKTNNSLYNEVTDITKRFNALEKASTYTAERSGKVSAIQVENALPYGILSRIGGNVKTVSVGVPYNLSDSSNNGVERLDNGFKMTKNYAYIKTNIPKGASVTVYADSDDIMLKGFALSSTPGSGGLITEITTPLGTFVSATEAASFIAVWGIAGAVVKGFRIVFADPTVASVLTEDSLDIPNEITLLSGYGANGAYLDLSEKKFYTANGTATDVSDSLIEALETDECDVISLLPGAVIRFKDASGNAVAADYMLTYKNKL